MLEKQKIGLLAHKFGLNIKKYLSNYPGVYHLYLKNGKQLCLKRIRYPIQRLYWIDQTLHHIRQSGFSQLVWRSKNTAVGKKLYVKLNPKTPAYILMPWINGRWPSPKSVQDMYQCGATLAKFHQASERVDMNKSNSWNKLGTWPDELRRKQSVLEKKINQISITQPRSMKLFLHKKKKEILDLCEQARNLLNTELYSNECSQKKAVICHGDGGPTNFIFTSRDVFLIDFETLRADLKAYDLYRIIYNSCKDNQWHFATAKALLDGYQSVKRITPEDIELMKIWLRFPRTTELLFKKINPAYPLNTYKLKKQLEEALRVERKLDDFLAQLSHYAKTEINKPAPA